MTEWGKIFAKVKHMTGSDMEKTKSPSKDPDSMTLLADPISEPRTRVGSSILGPVLAAQPIALAVTVVIVKIADLFWLWGLPIFTVIAPITILGLVLLAQRRKTDVTVKSGSIFRQSGKDSPKFSPGRPPR
ncbi:MAG: hypothetical protein WBB25_00260 [Sulfitobacter sp.]